MIHKLLTYWGTIIFSIIIFVVKLAQHKFCLRLPRQNRKLYQGWSRLFTFLLIAHPSRFFFFFLLQLWLCSLQKPKCCRGVSISVYFFWLGCVFRFFYLISKTWKVTPILFLPLLRHSFLRLLWGIPLQNWLLFVLMKD